MWTRREIKQYAKDFLKQHYWKAFIVCLIATLLSGGASTGTSNTYYPKNDNNKSSYYNNGQGMMYERDINIPSKDSNPIMKFASNRVRSPISFLARGVLPIMIIVFAILLVTVGFAMEVGKNRFFLDGFRGDTRIKKLFSTFNSNEYIPIVKTQFVRNIYIFLWTLLFIIPGIIKSYEYRFVPYILAEEPNLPSKQVIQRSRDMTRGHKTNMFILDLSFIGWYLLGSLLLGVGVLFVNPYIEATNARLYNVLLANDFNDYEYADYDIIN